MVIESNLKVPKPSFMDDQFVRGNLRWWLTVLTFIAGLAVFQALFSQFANLHGGDAYYHLSVARKYWQDGFFDSLSWARFSAMHRHFGDKEFLFHVLLMPFVWLLPSQAGGNWALAFFNALIAAMITNLSIRAIGKWGIFIPVWMFGTAAAFSFRMTFLRPEILSLILLILATWMASRHKYFWLMIAAAAYSLSYTAFHALLGLSLGWFFYIGWISRKWNWRLLLYTGLGVAFGLMAHPNFPSNCYIWWIQNVDFFRYKAYLPVGKEIYPHTTATALVFNFGWLLGLYVFWRSGEKIQAESVDAGPEAFFLINAVAFSLLYLLMQRFSIYCMPFVTLYILFEIRRRGEKIGRWCYPPWRGKIPFIVAFCLCLMIGMNSCWWVYYNLKQDGAFTEVYQENWRQIQSHLPQGARVVAPWDFSELYIWAAPQASYTNLLDPIFMAVSHPRLYELQRSIWANKEPDVPLAVRIALDSEYLLAPLSKQSALYQKLAGDPRVEVQYSGMDALFFIKTERPDDFVMDWRIVPASGEWPLPLEQAERRGFVYPRHTSPGARKLEAYIDARRVTGKNKQAQVFHCIHVKEVDEPVFVTYELAAYGPATFWHNGEKSVEINAPLKAALGNGVFFSLRLEKGRHLFSVSTRTYEGHMGFYLVERNRVAIKR